jgi:surfeit locus 1 family protein
MRARTLMIWLAGLLLMAATARLGFWQLDRAGQKVALQRAIAERQLLPEVQSIELAREADDAGQQLHRRASLEGVWLDASTVLLENRQMNGRTGFHALTPLQLADRSAVLVQRGWLPRDFQDRTRVTPPPLPPGPVTVQGRIAPPPARLYEFAAAASGVLRQNLDLEAYGREVGVKFRPLTLLQLSVARLPPDGLQRDWPAPAVDVHKHHGYAFQWFSLSGLTLVLLLWFQVIAPRRRARKVSAATVP